MRERGRCDRETRTRGTAKAWLWAHVAVEALVLRSFLILNDYFFTNSSLLHGSSPGSIDTHMTADAHRHLL